MRTSIGGTWLLGLMLFFIALFAAFIILVLNYSKTVKVKDESLSIIEKYEGLNSESIELLNNYLSSTGYLAKGICTGDSTRGVYGARDLSEYYLEEAQPNTKYYYCVKKYTGVNISNYYQLTLFYNFNLPVIHHTAGFVIRGTTTNFIAYDDSQYSVTIGG